jgi:hypothetical protein
MTWSTRSLLIAAAIAALPAVAVLAGEGRRVASDRAAIESAVRDYVDAIYDVDPSKIERSVRPDMVKRGFFHASDGQYGEHVMDYEELLLLAAEWNAEGETDVTAAPREVRILAAELQLTVPGAENGVGSTAHCRQLRLGVRTARGLLDGAT